MRAERSATQYRERDTELACVAPIETVLARTEAKIAKLAKAFTLTGQGLAARLLMSVRPEFACALMAGRKQVEVRRRFSKKWEGARVALYATKPAGVLLGEVTIRRVIEAPPAQLWRDYGSRMGCTYDQFRAYVGDLSEAVAIEVDQPRPYTAPISLVEIERWLTEVPRPPQSFVCVDADDPWGKVLAIVSLLHGSFASRATRGRAVAAA
jgi:predicted transcriptional regulator